MVFGTSRNFPSGRQFGSGLLMVLAVLAILLPGRLRAQEPEPAELWQFGAARAKITPAEPMWMSGYGSRDRVAEGTLTELWAKALMLESTGGRKAILITLDIVGIDKTLSDSIRQQIAAEQGLEPPQVVLCCSHTHTGPVIGLNLAPLHYLQVDDQQQAQIDRYATWLQQQVVNVAKEACADPQPGTVQWGNGHCDLAVNRRNNREDQVPSLRTAGTLAGPQDHDVPVMLIKDQQGDPRVVVFGYACHATVLSFYRWSGDYPGFAQVSLEQRIPGVQAMFWAGCGADQNPLPRREVELARHYGERLALAVEAVVRTRQMTPVTSRLEIRDDLIPLALASIPDESALQGQLNSQDRFERARASWLLQQLQDQPALPDHYPYPIVSWRLGDQVQWVFLGGEVVVDYAVRIKQEHRGSATWVAAYANDVMAYIPSRRVLREGGYEGGGAMVYYGLPSPWHEDVERVIVETVGRQLTD